MFSFFKAFTFPEELTVATFSFVDVNVTFPALPLERVTFNCKVFPGFRFLTDALSLTDFGLFFTVILHSAVLPFPVRTVIVAVPVFLAVILPLELTDATFLSLLVHVILLVFAYFGTSVLFKVYVSCTPKVFDFLFSLILSTACVTVTLQDAFLPFTVVTVTVALPDFLAVIFPFWSTFRTDVLLLFQVSFVLVVLDGATLVFKVYFYLF